MLGKCEGMSMNSLGLIALRRASRLLAAVLPLMLGLVMVISDPCSTFIQDEFMSMSASGNPPSHR